MDKNNLQFILTRERIIQLIRNFFIDHGFHEIITPVLNKHIPLEPNIYPFTTDWQTINGKETYYLSTSPEKNLKKMLSLGMEKCFSIGHSFRNLEASGSLHSPEFLMLEWYRKNANYNDIMNDTEQMINHVYKKMGRVNLNILKQYNRISLPDLFEQYCHLHIKRKIFSDKELFTYAEEKGYQTKGATWGQLYDQIFVNEIEPLLPNGPCFLVDFPSRISPLCKPKQHETHLAERFEFYINGIELANGNTENTDYRSVETVFKNEQKYRKKRGLPHTDPDRDFISSLKQMDGNQYAGIGMGIDRLAMILNDPLTSNSSADDSRVDDSYTV